jgi:hypothetical protein
VFLLGNLGFPNHLRQYIAGCKGIQSSNNSMLNNLHKCLTSSLKAKEFSLAIIPIILIIHDCMKECEEVDELIGVILISKLVGGEWSVPNRKRHWIRAG